MYQSKILGTGSYLPEKTITNFDLEKMVETSNEWILERTGIKERHIAAEDEAASDIGMVAAKRALEAAKLTAQDIDAIVFATVSADQLMPTAANMLQYKLGCRPIMSFDLSAACSGFVYALTVADSFIKTGLYKTVLVVAAEVLHHNVDYTDRETCILFGDGAGSVVLGRNEEPQSSRILSSHHYSDGDLGDLLIVPGGGSKIPMTHEAVDLKLNKIKMKGREIFKHAVRTLTRCSQEALQSNNLTIEQLDWFVPHQANIRIIEAVAKHFGIPNDKVIVNIENMGNTSSATIPVVFDQAVRDGRIKRGQTVLFSAFGGGITSGSVIFKY